MYVFVFFKQKTAYEWRISDWSSDGCSSDLHLGQHLLAERAQAVPRALDRVGGIGDGVGGAVGEGDVAHAAVEEELHVGQVVAERRAVLHAQRQQHAFALAQRVDILGRKQQCEPVRMALRQRFDRVDHLVGHLPRAVVLVLPGRGVDRRSEEHTSELQSLMRISYAVFWFNNKMSIHKLS